MADPGHGHRIVKRDVRSGHQSSREKHACLFSPRGGPACGWLLCRFLGLTAFATSAQSGVRCSLEWYDHDHILDMRRWCSYPIILLWNGYRHLLHLWNRFHTNWLHRGHRFDRHRSMDLCGKRSVQDPMLHMGNVLLHRQTVLGYRVRNLNKLFQSRKSVVD